MMTSATGTWSKPEILPTPAVTPPAPAQGTGRITGFTLMEILVTLIILSLVLGVVLLRMNLQDYGVELKQEARRLAHLLETAGQEAVFQSREIGFYLDEGEYAFYTLQEEQWKPIDDELLRKRTLRPHIEISISTDGQPYSAQKQKKQVDQVQPQILLESSGEWTPFEIQVKSVEDESRYYVLSNLETGELQLKSLP